jgi:hypothetical protein
MPQGGDMVKKATVVFVMLVLSLVTACAPAAPTPTLGPARPTPVEVLATKPEHLASLWFDGASYQRYEPDGTITVAESIENLDSDYVMTGRFWFKDGIYYEEPPVCMSLLVYEAYLQIEEGRAVRARLTIIEEPDPPCSGYGRGTQRRLERVD